MRQLIKTILAARGGARGVPTGAEPGTGAGADIIEKIRRSVIGERRLFRTAFGWRPLIYADYTASGRALGFVEDYIRDQVLPFYANTHSESSVCGKRTTACREAARQMIKQAVKAGEDHLVIFYGSGATAAIHKLIDILNLRLPADLNDRYDFLARIPEAERPVVFIGPYEHHSNELPWRESIADLVVIRLTPEGLIDQRHLEDCLDHYQDRPLKIGSFSAASNVTGVLSEVRAISRILHRHGAMAFWDYAAAAPYVGIDVTGRTDDQGDSSLDAVFISPHKFIGGPGTPGVLVVKKALLTNRVPAVPGGGTVLYVTPQAHTYLPAGEAREEGGTPAIVESIRAGLVFKLKETVGAERIERLEREMVSTALGRWGKNPNIQILGNPELPRISIVSFNILRQGRPLHFGFVAALMNDLFGIQVRGGCSCAGPYGHELLGLDSARSAALEKAVEAGFHILKMGWVRLNFNYFIDRETFDYILRAVELVAEHGWKLYALYDFHAGSGEWIHRDDGENDAVPLVFPLHKNMSETLAHRGETAATTCSPGDLRNYLKAAEDILRAAPRVPDRLLSSPLPEEVERLRWFALPQDWENCQS
ncbi:aminotransferase class V-fold PLP-dependent enzyme [Luteithermobacter gelatinilyticus]|uniref:aminotransferase class V-fold PLP-dependent enzyme n=1 Tax=Luteithermobacter gelatinilyticus TaxID=2582913 RepID=UPI001106C44B|nr:aminotransferase class V-fold PLP-dependent enzyme [Luteithermobacter gelatinilyticus]